MPQQQPNETRYTARPSPPTPEGTPTPGGTSSPHDRMASALEAISGSLADLRQCLADSRARLRERLPWVLVWLFLLFANLDEGTRKMIRALWDKLNG